MLRDTCVTSSATGRKGGAHLAYPAYPMYLAYLAYLACLALAYPVYLWRTWHTLRAWRTWRAWPTWRAWRAWRTWRTWRAWRTTLAAKVASESLVLLSRGLAADMGKKLLQKVHFEHFRALAAKVPSESSV